MTGAAATRRPGLWKVTTSTTWQKSPQILGAPNETMKDQTHETQVCLTQEMIDKYGALLPHSRGRCTLANKSVDPGIIRADYMCSGMMSGKGDLISIWSDVEHSQSSLHFVGTLRVGAKEEPIEWTTKSNAVFESASCGSIPPAALP